MFSVGRLKVLALVLHLELQCREKMEVELNAWEMTTFYLPPLCLLLLYEAVLRPFDRSSSRSLLHILAFFWTKSNRRVDKSLKMAHRICCPRHQDRELISPEPPSRPRIEMDGALDSALMLGMLPEDHPHGRRFHLSPVDFNILRSPRIADKIKLKMGRKSSRTLRKQLSQIMDGPYNTDAHAMTSNSIVAATGTPSLPDDANEEGRKDRPQTPPSRTLKRFGTTSASDDAAQLGRPRPTIYSPSVYSRSASRVDGDKPRVGKSTMNRLLRPNSDFFGLAYRMILSRKPSVSTNGNHHSRRDSRHLSASTDSTITRRLEESGIDGTYDTLYDPAYYHCQSHMELKVRTLGTSTKDDGEQSKAHVHEHKRQVSEHRERVGQ